MGGTDSDLIASVRSAGSELANLNWAWQKIGHKNDKLIKVNQFVEENREKENEEKSKNMKRSMPGHDMTQKTRKFVKLNHALFAPYS